MKRKLILVTAMAMMLAACARTGPAPAPTTSPAPAAPLTISYKAGACFGACPMYSVTVSADGKGRFVGERFTAVTGGREFTVTPEQFEAFRAALQPYRPASGDALYQPGSALCPNAATDMPSIDVSWHEAGKDQRLYYYFGCNMQDRRIADALGNAADALPIGELVGARP